MLYWSYDAEVIKFIETSINTHYRKFFQSDLELALDLSTFKFILELVPERSSVESMQLA